MQSVATIELQIPVLPPETKQATVFKEMTKALFSIPVVCDGSMDVTFRKNDVIITSQQKEVVLKGIRDPDSSLWLIPINDHKRTYIEPL
jgi:hypothetical protein